MQLANKTAVIYGGGGAIGGAVARAFAREGAHVFLAGRTLAKLDAVAADISAAGGLAETAQVDALDAGAVHRHADAVAAKAGRIDIVLNAVGVVHVQGTPIDELSLDDYAYPIACYTQTNFITAKAAARHMRYNKGGVIFTLSTPASRMPGPGYLGHSVACAGVEAFTRHLAGELAPDGIRVICLRAHMIPEAVQAGSHSKNVFLPAAERDGITVEEMMAEAASGTLLRRLPTLAEVANTAVFMASGHAASITGAIVNLNSGFILD